MADIHVTPEESEAVRTERRAREAAARRKRLRGRLGERVIDGSDIDSDRETDENCHPNVPLTPLQRQRNDRIDSGRETNENGNPNLPLTRLEVQKDLRASRSPAENDLHSPDRQRM